MNGVNVEIKARCHDVKSIRAILRKKRARFEGTDHQVDTYFKVASGRLKLRCGDIENSLIFYNRPDRAGPRKSRVSLCRLKPSPELHDVLAKALGVLAVVRKRREIYFIDNVKFHIDEVEDLGCFVEVEASDASGRIKEEVLTAQARQYAELFGITDGDLVACSYSDMIVQLKTGPASSR